MTTATSRKPAIPKKPAQTAKRPIASEATQTERTQNPVSMALGQSLKSMRVARDLSQEQLAGRAEIDRTLISRIERGVSNPSLLTLSTICYVLDVRLTDLLAPVEQNIPPRSVDPAAPVRRKNQAGADHREAPARRLR